MMIEEALHFSPNYKYVDLNFSKNDQLINAFEDRVRNFYFEPARHLQEDMFSFARGVLIFAAIDFFQHYSTGGAISTRIKEFCGALRSINGLSNEEREERVKILYDDYRNGLVHSGEIKRLGQFSLDGNELMIVRETFTIVNPSVLLEETIEVFNNKMENLRQSSVQTANVCERLRTNFRPR